MAIKKCKPNNSVKFLKKGYTNQDFIDEYKKLLDEWKKFSDFKDDLWHTTMKNDKRCMQLDFKVWYLEWQNESLKKKVSQLDPNDDLSDWSYKSPEAASLKVDAEGRLKKGDKHEQ